MPPPARCASRTCRSLAETTWKGRPACTRCYNRAWTGGDFEEPRAAQRAWRDNIRREARKFAREGLSPKETAEKLGVNLRTVRRVLGLEKPQ